jgi:CBS domain-containing protein
MQPTVGEVMATRVAWVRPQAPLGEVAKLLRERAVTAVPVVDEEDHVLGVVSGMDLAMDREQPHRAPAAMQRLARHARGKSARTTAADRMSSPVVTVTPAVSLRTAARLLQVHGIHHLPVVAGGKLVGMVTRRDLLAAFLRDDEQVRRQIVHTLEMTYHLTSDRVAVTVHNGVVRLDGRVEQHSLVDEVQRLVAGVDGVIGVESQLAWEIDDTAPDVEGRVSQILQS